MSDVATKQRSDVATTGSDPFAAYGRPTGVYLSFSKAGEWEAGQDKEMLPFGTRLIANMPGFRIGWRRWVDKKIDPDLTELLADGIRAQRRSDLGDTDEGLWERDKDGKPIDPWQFVNSIELSNGETTYLYSTGSNGGKRALQELCAKYAKERRMRPDELPIIELQRDSYKHKEFGKTYVPELKIVGWTDENNPSVDDISTEAPPAQGQRAANPTQGTVAVAPVSPTTSQTISHSEAGGEYRAAATMKAEARQDLHAAGVRRTRF